MGSGEGDQGGQGSGTLMGGSGTAVADDHFTKAEGFPEDLASKVERFSDVPALAKGYSEAMGKLSQSISLPREDAPEEEKTAQLSSIYAKLGIEAGEDVNPRVSAIYRARQLGILREDT